MAEAANPTYLDEFFHPKRSKEFRRDKINFKQKVCDVDLDKGPLAISSGTSFGIWTKIAEVASFVDHQSS